MMTYRTLFTLIVLQAITLLAQDRTLTLEEVRAAALANHPATTDRQLAQEAAELRATNVRTQFFPQVSAVAQGTYQSEVTEFDLSPLGFPPITISKDQYRAGLELKQSIYDFGALHTMREAELTKGQVQAAQADVDLMNVAQRVDELYGSILLQQANLRILRSRAAEIAARQARVASAVRNGVSLKSNEEVLRAEALSTEQRIVETQANLVAQTTALSVLSGQPVDTSMSFTLPQVPAGKAPGQRPELHLFDLQHQASDLQVDLVRKKNMPRLGVFADGYYGRPGFNFLNNEMRPYGIAGIGISWNITGLYTQGREVKANGIEQQMIDDRKRLFEMQQRIQLAREDEEISKLDKLVELDERIVESKTLIVTSAASQLENGVITSQEYLTYQNAQDQARADLEMHRIRAIMARIDHQRTQGGL